MTDSNFDDLGSQLAKSVVRHVAQYLAGTLLALGAISSDQQTQTVLILTSVGAYAVMQGWSFMRQINRKRR